MRQKLFQLLTVAELWSWHAIVQQRYMPPVLTKFPFFGKCQNSGGSPLQSEVPLMAQNLETV